MANDAQALSGLVSKVRQEEQAKAQRFFVELAASIATPHVGDIYRDIIRAILLRATEAGLYGEEHK